MKPLRKTAQLLFFLCNFKMDEEFKNFLLKKKISEEKYDGMTGELQFKWSELFEKSKPQGNKLLTHYIFDVVL